MYALRVILRARHAVEVLHEGVVLAEGGRGQALAVLVNDHRGRVSQKPYDQLALRWREIVIPIQ
eukprot:2504558-Pyramimonas_sp.AAC.1